MYKQFKTAYDAFLAFAQKGATTSKKPVDPIEAEHQATLLQAQGTLAKGSPSSKDVKAAQNAIYLSTKGKAGGLDIGQAMATVLRRKRFQEASKVVGLSQAFAGGAK
jgi:hypothetical protein